MKKLFLVVGLLSVASLAGCTGASVAKLGAYGKSSTITLYSGGKVVKTWKSTGKVANEQNSDGYYFQDMETKQFVTVSGDVVIEIE